jgi:hypothetical protein
MKLFNPFRSPGGKNYLPGDYRPDITTDLVFKMVFSGTSRESKDAPALRIPGGNGTGPLDGSGGDSRIRDTETCGNGKIMVQ